MFKVAKVIGSSSSYMFNPQCYTKEAASEFDVANNGFSAIFATSPFFGKQLFILFLPIISVAMSHSSGVRWAYLKCFAGTTTAGSKQKW